MDTFAKKKEGSPVVIWPRDILPKVDGFQNTRIMTFDYNSKILDRSDDTRPSDWAKDLLHCVNIAREGSTVIITPRHHSRPSPTAHQTDNPWALD